MNPVYPLTLLYDGACPICRREVAFLARRDSAAQLRFVDIAAAGFEPRAWGRAQGLADFPDAAALDARIHAVTAAREIVVGLDVFRLAWRAVGLGRLASITGWPLLRPLAERAYLAFARNRHGLSRRLDRVLRRSSGGATQTADDRCAAGTCRAWRSEV